MSLARRWPGHRALKGMCTPAATALASMGRVHTGLSFHAFPAILAVRHVVSPLVRANAVESWSIKDAKDVWDLALRTRKSTSSTAAIMTRKYGSRRI